MFLKNIKNRHFWPRIRTLVGAPPFAFLSPQDDSVLRAAGIQRNRTHMSALSTTLPNYSEFGPHGQFVDNHDRHYKIVSRSNNTDATSDGVGAHLILPFVGLKSGDSLLVDVRVKKRNRSTKLAVISGSNNTISKESLVFPARGARLQVVPHKRLTNAATLHFDVSGVFPRSTQGNVARLQCKVL